MRNAPAAVARVAATINQRKSATTPLSIPCRRFISIRLASSGAWNEFDVRETSISRLNRAYETAIRPVRVPAIRTE
jgi:hypothetical protein